MLYQQLMFKKNKVAAVIEGGCMRDGTKDLGASIGRGKEIVPDLGTGMITVMEEDALHRIIRRV